MFFLREIDVFIRGPTTSGEVGGPAAAVPPRIRRIENVGFPKENRCFLKENRCLIPESASEGFLLCRSSAGVELCFPGACRRGAGAVPA